MVKMASENIQNIKIPMSEIIKLNMKIKAKLLW